VHERRLSALGPGGLNRKRAGFEVRDVHISHYGRICPIETPEGTNIGLIARWASTRDRRVRLPRTPYREVKTAVDGQDRPPARRRGDEGRPGAADASSPGRQAEEGRSSPASTANWPGRLGKVDYVDISPKQIVGISAALIPFLEHDDANRALMGSNMQRQAVPLIKVEPPCVATGMEKDVGHNSGMVVKAKNAAP
jgi:DNA-directed RNA polymerase subunit beta